MKFIYQLCIESFQVKAQNGDEWTAEQGKTYTTSVPKEEKENVTVFSNFWVSVPKKNFVPIENQKLGEDNG